MALTRRDFLRMGSLTAVAVSASACSTMGRQLDQAGLPEQLALPPEQRDIFRRLLDRAGYGPRPGDVARARQLGLEAYLEEQLHPERIEDTAVDLIERSLTRQAMDISQVIEQDPREVTVELVGSTLLRAIYSQRQLYEAMVEFWSDHFNIYAQKNMFMPALKLIDDREVIRPFALGKFRDLLWASAKSPAMLLYLDNVDNDRGHPNENYARELLELHTVGVHAGYTQTDVQELARALTGWTIARRGLDKGQVVFKPELHDDGEKALLGQVIPAGQGAADLDQVLELLVTHPATARFIATKLVRRFVADDPPQPLVDEVATVFQQTDGDIKAMLRTIFLSETFATAPPKLKRPFTFMVSTLRALNSQFRLGRGRELRRWFQLLGQVPFHWPPPNGFPDVSVAWSANLLPRWNFALALLHGELDGANLPLDQLIEAAPSDTLPDQLALFSGLTLGRQLTTAEATLLMDYVNGGADVNGRLRDCVALMLASPAFQWT